MRVEGVANDALVRVLQPPAPEELLQQEASVTFILLTMPVVKRCNKDGSLG